MINKTFSQLPNFILYELEKGFLKPIDVCLYFALKFHVGSKQVCWATIPTLARECNKCTSTIDGSISRLKERGQKHMIVNSIVSKSLAFYSICIWCRSDSSRFCNKKIFHLMFFKRKNPPILLRFFCAKPLKIID